MVLPNGELNTGAFTRPVAALLEKYGSRPLPLTQNSTCAKEEAKVLGEIAAKSLFPGAREAEGAVSGLLLLLGCWDKAHQTAQDIASPEGSYWHAFIHRMEPDAWNSDYWFRQVGQHPIFPDLHAAASELLANGPATGWRLKAIWEPSLFIRWCDEARNATDTPKEQTAVRIQQEEWRLLFNWCASTSSS
jgi:hypothetical protein